MANPSNTFQIPTGFMHAGPQRVYHRNGQAIYESIYKSGAIIFADEILKPQVALPFTASQTDLDAWIVSNPGVLRKYTRVVLTRDPISNGELYYINDPIRGGIQRPILQEQFVTHPETLQPANAYVVALYRGTDAAVNPGAQIGPTEGVWFVKPDQGFFHFQNGSTPTDMGWGTITATCYVYIGETLADAVAGGGAQVRAYFEDESILQVFSDDFPLITVWFQTLISERPYQFNRWAFNTAQFNQQETIGYTRGEFSATYSPAEKALTVTFAEPHTGIIVHSA